MLIFCQFFNIALCMSWAALSPILKQADVLIKNADFEAADRQEVIDESD
jgi:hypothetical protein